MDNRQGLQGERQDSNWSKVALNAKPMLASLRHGEREHGLRVAAESLGVTAQTLRRAVSALDFVETFKFGVNLKSAPLAAVEAVRRWSQYDPQEAIRAAEHVLSGGTVEWIIEAERRARSAKRTRIPATASIQDDYISVVKNYFLINYPEWSCNPKKKHRRHNSVGPPPPANLTFYDKSLHQVVATATLLNPDIERSDYIYRIVRELMRAIALEQIYGNSFVVCSELEIMQSCKAWLNCYVKDCRVKVVFCSPEFSYDENFDHA